jgi:putative restriction endonuclease
MLLAVTDPQYRGNEGYDDEVEQVYRYDSNVANHLRLAAGHFVLLRRDDEVVGAAVVTRVDSKAAKKAINVCPKCGSSGIKARRNALPRFRCFACKEQFAEPKRRFSEVTAFEAWYGGFIRPSAPLSVDLFRGCWLQFNDQFSIKAMSAQGLDGVLRRHWPEAAELLRLSAAAGGIAPGDSDDEPPPDPGYAPSPADQREKVMRQIRARRGQRKFREALLRAFGRRCVFSGCALVDLLEAAHILPYRGDADHHASNGLLLRADLHTLFDLNLIAIDPAGFELRLGAALAGFGYDDLEGKRLDPLAMRKVSKVALKKRWAAFEASAR